MPENEGKPTSRSKIGTAATPHKPAERKTLVTSHKILVTIGQVFLTDNSYLCNRKPKILYNYDEKKYLIITAVAGHAAGMYVSG